MWKDVFIWAIVTMYGMCAVASAVSLAIDQLSPAEQVEVRWSFVIEVAVALVGALVALE